MAPVSEELVLGVLTWQGPALESLGSQIQHCRLQYHWCNCCLESPQML